ncbi:MAG TPA: DmsE family decaheme c-type cytochrome [Blastocatellia bacterium]|nr:DmsE family decaheme c-type cytochrome [Blastocatellia bacterium]
MSMRLSRPISVKRAVPVLAVLFVFLFIAIGLAGSNANSGEDGRRVAADSDYIGVETCRKCHEDEYQKFKETKMGKIVLDSPRTQMEARGCESCHGPGRAHAEAGGDVNQIIRFSQHADVSRDLQTQQCLQCHEKGARMFWRGSTHESRGLSCVSCHQVMRRAVGAGRFLEPLTENRNFATTTRMEVCFECHQLRRAQLLRSSHMPFREGKVTCTNCHNPHGTPNPKLLTESTTNENCYKCHAERRGPFLWEHPPVMEDCLNCHDAHGSSNPQLLKARTPRLCQRCHIEARHPTTPQLATTRFSFNRSCTNCHSQIHGSNHPSGVRFQR